MRYVSRMWETLRAGRSFDVILVVVAGRHQRDLLRRYFGKRGGWNTLFGSPPVLFASLDELGRPWRGGNFDASLFAIHRIRRLLAERGVPEEDGRSLAVLAAGEGTRAYPLTVAERGDKSMIKTPAQVGGRSLRLIELVIAQYHQILDEVEPGRIHVAAGDHILAWTRPPRAAEGQAVQILVNRVSFASEAQAAGLIDARQRPLWNDEAELRGRLGAIGGAVKLPVLRSLAQMGILKASTDAGNLLCLMEKPDIASTLAHFTDRGAEARVNWWDWSLSSEAARLLVRRYTDLMGSGIDFSMDVLEPATMEREEWWRRRPHRNPRLWERANALFSNATMSRVAPLGPIGVADAGEGSIFADLGTLKGLYEAYATALEMTPEGEDCRTLFGATLEDGTLYVGERPHPRVEVQPGSIVIESAGIRSGRIGTGGIVVDTAVGNLQTAGRCVVYGVRGKDDGMQVGDGEVTADVVHHGRRCTVRGSFLGLATKKGDHKTWSRPHHGNPMSFSDLHAELTMRGGDPAVEMRKGVSTHRANPGRRRRSWITS